MRPRKIWSQVQEAGGSPQPGEAKELGGGAPKLASGEAGVLAQGGAGGGDTLGRE